jgi:hypothetical protein
MSALIEQSGWVGERGERVLEPVFEPDMAGLIDGCDDETHDDLTACAEVMREIFRYCFAHRNGSDKLPELNVAFRRFCCVVWLLRPELLGHVSLMELAPMLGVTRAALSKAIRNYGDAHGIRNALQKRESARAIYRDAQKRDHWRRRTAKQVNSDVT